MKLSVVLVNCDERRLLKQSLAAIFTSFPATETEVIVLDNASADRSAGMIKADFPEVQLIENSQREGYTRAANQALLSAKGEYVLLLNPAIVVGADTLQKTVAFMDDHTQTGALGVRMINASGHFLPESKHGLPHAWAKFFKYLFLFRFFPKLRANHHQSFSGWTEEFDSAEVDVLCRNFILFRKSVLVKAGFFDERFVHYGQDIDLSYRIRMAGYKNYYFAKTHVVNYQHSTTNKLSWSYLKNFYGAMFTFAAKYLFRMPAISLGTAKPVPASL